MRKPVNRVKHSDGTMFVSLLFRFKNFFLELHKHRMLKLVVTINILYYICFFLVALYEIEWPQKKVIIISNKQLGLIISIFISVATYFIWSIVTFRIGKIFRLNYRFSAVTQTFFSLNLISLFVLILNTLLYLLGVSSLGYTILWFDLVLKSVLLFFFLYESPAEELSKAKASLLCVMSIISMFLISSLLYLLPYENTYVEKFNRKDELRVDNDTVVYVDSLIFFRQQKSMKGKFDSHISSKDLVENYYTVVLYENLIRASVTESGLNQNIKNLPIIVKSDLNETLQDREINIHVSDIKMEIDVRTTN